MNETTKKLQQLVKSRKNRTVVYEQINKSYSTPPKTNVHAGHKVKGKPAAID